jgi:hypothetical protein
VLSAAALMDIGRAGTGPEQSLRDVVGAVRLSTGVIAVADAAAREVRYFGADGLFLYRALGADGLPPAFAALGSLTRAAADSVLAFDPEAGRVLLVAADGRVGRHVTLEWDGPVGLDRAAAFEDGSIAVRTAWRPTEVPVASGVGRAPIRFLRFSADGAFMDTITSAPGPEVATMALGAARSFVTPPLGAVTVHAVGEHDPTSEAGSRWRYASTPRVAA